MARGPDVALRLCLGIPILKIFSYVYTRTPIERLRNDLVTSIFTGSKLECLPWIAATEQLLTA